MPAARSASSSPRLLMTVPTTGPRRVPASLSERGDDVEQLIPIDDAAEMIDHDEPITVAIERKSHIGAHAGHGELQQLRRRGAAAIVDVAAVGRAADRHDLGAEVGEDARADLVGGAVGAVDDDLQPRQVSACGSVAAQNSW